MRAARRGARNIVTRKLDLEQALGSTVRRPRHGPARTPAPAQLTGAPSFAQGSMGEIAVKHREQLVGGGKLSLSSWCFNLIGMCARLLLARAMASISWSRSAP